MLVLDLSPAAVRDGEDDLVVEVSDRAVVFCHEAPLGAASAHEGVDVGGVMQQHRP
jgi:hypothetical protein